MAVVNENLAVTFWHDAAHYYSNRLTSNNTTQYTLTH